ncbi:MAG: hypothetical protein IPI01_14480 [Ignavibacteriae bacterium]|nr:hypothetical protein [Ignavibacteriota bacterium]
MMIMDLSKRSRRTSPIAIIIALVLPLGSVPGCTARTAEGGPGGGPPGTVDSANVGGAFENGEFMYAGLQGHITAIDTSPGWQVHGQRLLLTGRVFRSDGTTPAPGVVLYYYQTNTEGQYLHKTDEPRSMAPNAQGQTHGYIRGWVKSDAEGRYWIYTIRPGTYPSRDFPAHVHVTVKEPNGINEYYIDDFVFDDDRLLTSAYRQRQECRGGSGVVRLVQRDGLHIGERNIFLGLNIPDHPGNAASGRTSGKNIGEDVFSFTPYHAWGPDKGSRTCPVCKYGWFHGVLYFVGSNPDWAEIRQWLRFLEGESITRGDRLKVYFVYGDPNGYSRQARERALEKVGRGTPAHEGRIDVRSFVRGHRVRCALEPDRPGRGEYVHHFPAQHGCREICCSEANTGECRAYHPAAGRNNERV